LAKAAIAGNTLREEHQVPVNRFHAFADGPAWHRPVAGAEVDPAQAQVWAQFDRHAELSPLAMLGQAAWCIGQGGDRRRICVGDGSVVRGILRIDSFGNGRIFIGRDSYLGDDTIISAAAAVIIGDRVLIGHGVQIFDNNTHPATADARRRQFDDIRAGRPFNEEIGAAPVHIANGAWIGMNSLVMKGVTIGPAAVVAAGSVVIEDVPAGWLVAGNPARPIKPMEEHALPLPRGGAAPAPATGEGSLYSRPDYPIMARVVPALSKLPKAEENAWYPPVMAGAETLAQRLYRHDHVAEALDLLHLLEPDSYSCFLADFYREGRARFGMDWRYADIVTVLLCLAEALQPEHYLEIGVRRGRSACAVISRSPHCRLALFDMWQADYAGMANPGPDFVAGELRKVGCQAPEVVFVNGDSHQTLPDYFAAHPNAAFDLITVDGDHTPEGAAQDLRDVLPRLAIGGAVVFDDIAHPQHPELAAVWRRLVVEDDRYSSFSYTEAGYGVGFAIRKY
jgi:acetyltransferase-like isoleucine patch superfamily enzyme/predicted O-methyltransferase YrrM